MATVAILFTINFAVFVFEATCGRVSRSVLDTNVSGRPGRLASERVCLQLQEKISVVRDTYIIAMNNTGSNNITT